VGQRHEVLQNLTLVEEAREAGRKKHERPPSALEFTVSPEAQEYAAVYLSERGVTADGSLVAIHPGAGAPVKQWKPESFAEVADVIAHRWGAKIVITGSHDELDLAWSIHARMHSDPIIASGETSLGQLAALFRRCCLVMGPDCGPLHLAVAAGTPTVHLYGPTDPTKFGPWGNPEMHIAITSDRNCAPCHRLDYTLSELPDHPCVREIPVKPVLEAVQRLL
jgi:heptosyltransferase-2/heptosyltransferase-3